MRKTIRTALAATAVVGLLAIPAAGAGAASGSTTGSLTLNGSTGSLSISVPNATASSPVDLGTKTIAAGNITTNTLGTITASDTETGLLRVTTVDTDTGLNNTALAFCQDDDGDVAGGVTCSTTTTEQILLAAAQYSFGTVDNSGSTTGTPPVAVDGPLGTAALANTTALSGTLVWEWTPTFTITLTGLEEAGTYYGVVTHSISSTGTAV